jgi:hypothetical protein
MINPTSGVHPFSNAASNLPQLPFAPLKTPIFKPYPFIKSGDWFTGRSLLTPLKYGPLDYYRQQNIKSEGFFSNILYSYIEPSKIPRQIAFKVKISLTVLDFLHKKCKD